jgi:hypothetical protein
MIDASVKRYILCAINVVMLAVCVPTPVFAQDQKQGNTSNLSDNWLIKHHITQVGADGVTRELSFEERLYRRADKVWVERVMSPAAQAAHALSHKDEGNGKAHKHDQPPAMVKWISKPEGKVTAPRLRLIDAQDKLQVLISPEEFAQVGFEGSWMKAYHVIDPASLSKMKLVNVTSAEGVQTYESQQGAAENRNKLRVQWDTKAMLPRRVESSDSLGLNHSVTTLTPISSPSPEPWIAASTYRVKEYSDYLD